jgi:hypothetical protein
MEMDSTERILIALGDLKEDIGGLKADVRNINTRLDDIVGNQARHEEDDRKVASRVSTLEHARSRATGYVLALSAVGGLVTTAGVAIAKAIL